MTAHAQLKTHLDVAWRRKWWIAVPFVLAAALSAPVLHRLPKMYRASTTILVTPQRVPEDFVRSTVTQKVQDRMSSMSVQILSRSFLDRVVREFGKAGPDAQEGQIARASGRLRSRVELTSDRSFAYFEVAVEDENPMTAAGIANRLAELFIDENSLMRSEQASGTRSTVEGWLEQKKNELLGMEERVAAFKREHLWELSEQLDANLQLLETAQGRIASIEKDIQARRDRMTDLRSLSRLETSLGTTVSVEADPAEAKLAALETELAKLRVSYTEENPAVRQKVYEIAEFRRQHPELEAPAAQPGEPPSAGPTRRGESERLEREIENLERERERVSAQIRVLTARIDNTPLREQEFRSLTRGYDNLKREHDDLLQKREAAARSEDLEVSRKGEQFRVQDLAQPPTVPSRPQPLIVIAICLAAGLGIGIAITVVLEFLDQSLRTEEDFRRAFPDLPLLTAVPHLDPVEPGSLRRKPVAPGRSAAMAVLLAVLPALPWLAAASGWTRA